MSTVDYTNVHLPRTVKGRAVLGHPLTFCGMTQRVREWAKRAGMDPLTVTNRVRQQGMGTLDALTKPDRRGNFLHPLTPEEVEAEARAHRKLQTHIQSDCSDPPVYRAVIWTSRSSVDLGTYPSFLDACRAMDTAMALLPREWSRDDAIEIEPAVQAEAFSRIKTEVERLNRNLLTDASADCSDTPLERPSNPNQLEGVDGPVPGEGQVDSADPGTESQTPNSTSVTSE